jgi:hypothetical protein
MRGERGMVTAELALAAMLATTAAIGMAYLIAIVIVLGHCHATAAEVARQEARGDTAAAARARGDRPSGAVVVVNRSGRDVVVTVTLQARPWGAWLPGVGLNARAVVLEERR